MKPMWFQNESDESTFSCYKATKIRPDGATCVFLSTWGSPLQILNSRQKLNFESSYLVDEAAAQVGEGDALDEPGVEAEEVVDGVGVVPEAVLLGEDGEGGLEHVEEAGYSRAPISNKYSLFD